MSQLHSIKLQRGIITPNSLCKLNDGILISIFYHTIHIIDLDNFSLISSISMDQGNLSCITKLNDGTLRENLIFDKKINDNKIIKVLKLVCLDKFYEKLEDGLDTELGEKGVRMSGGERQRVALARLFFDDSKIIILDEATSTMDNITERQVMENIIKQLDKKTLIIIAHRLETIKEVDKIYVLCDGGIQEEGKYFELLNKNGYFTKLYKSEK